MAIEQLSVEEHLLKSNMLLQWYRYFFSKCQFNFCFIYIALPISLLKLEPEILK